MDSTVPAECGRLLWERMDRPERYTYTLGHRLLFWTLGNQAKRIADWSEHAIKTGERHGPSVAQQPAASPTSTTTSQ